MNLNRFSVKAIIIFLLLHSNFLSFGMAYISLQKPYSSMELKKNLLLSMTKKKLGQLKKNKLSDPLNVTTKELNQNRANNDIVKQYLCAIKTGDEALAQSIKQSYPHLDMCYRFPYDLFYDRNDDCRKLQVYAIAFREPRKYLPHYSFEEYSAEYLDELCIAALQGNAQGMEKILRKKANEKFLSFDDNKLLKLPLMISLNEGNSVLASNLFDAINMLFEEQDVILFYFEILHILKIINDYAGFALAVSKVPSLTKTYYCEKLQRIKETLLYKKPPMNLLELMEERRDLFDENDFALIKRRRRELIKNTLFFKKIDYKDHFSVLPPEIKYLILDFVFWNDIRNLALTSKEKYSAYKKQQSLIRKYIAECSNNNTERANKIIRENPYLPPYYIPCFSISSNKNVKKLFDIKNEDFSYCWLYPIEVACITGDRRKLVESLKQENVLLCDLIEALCIAIKERHCKLYNLLMDKIHEVFSNDMVWINTDELFYKRILEFAKKIHRPDIVEWIISTIPSSLPNASAYNSQKIFCYVRRDAHLDPHELNLLAKQEKWVEIKKNTGWPLICYSYYVVTQFVDLFYQKLSDLDLIYYTIWQ